MSFQSIWDGLKDILSTPLLICDITKMVCWKNFKIIRFGSSPNAQMSKTATRYICKASKANDQAVCAATETNKYLQRVSQLTRERIIKLGFQFQTPRSNLETLSHNSPMLLRPIKLVVKRYGRIRSRALLENSLRQISQMCVRSAAQLKYWF